MTPAAGSATATELLAALHRHGVRLRADGERLLIDAPKGVLGQELIAEIRSRKSELLPLVADRRDELTAIPRIERDAGGGEFPLSLAQQPFFVQDQIEPGTRVYNIFSVRRLRFAVNPVRLANAVRVVVERHEALRTTFALHDHGAIQRVKPKGIAPLSVIDLSFLPKAARDRALAQAISRERAPRFDLSQLPLFRLELLRLETDEHVLSLAMHHIIADAASLDIFYADLVAAYRGEPTGAGLSDRPPRIEYGDYSAWQRGRLAAGAFEIAIASWQRNLSDPPNLLAALGAEASPEAEGIATYRAAIPLEIARKLGSQARREGVMTFVPLLAAYQLLLAYYSNLLDIPVIAIISGRNRPELRNLIGLFVSGVVVRTAIDPQAATSALWRSVQQTAIEALRHQEISLEVLEGLLRQRREKIPGFDNLAKVSFNFVPVEERSTSAIPGIEVIASDRGEAIFDMMLVAVEGSDGIALSLEIRTGLFPSGFGESVLSQYQTLLAAMIDAPEAAPSVRPSTREDELPGLLGLSDSASEHIRALDERQRALVGSMRGHPSAGLRVLGYEVLLPEAVPTATLMSVLGRLADQRPEMRARALRSRIRFLDPVYLAVSPPLDPTLLPIHSVAMTRGEKTPQKAAVTAAELSNPFGRTLWAAVLEKQGGASGRVIVLANELACDQASLAQHAAQLMSLLCETTPGDVDALACAPITVTHPHLTRPSMCLADSGEMIEPLVFPAESRSDQRTWFVSLRGSLGQPRLARLERLCGASGIGTDTVLLGLFGTLIATYADASRPFYLRLIDSRRVGHRGWNPTLCLFPQSFFDPGLSVAQACSAIHDIELLDHPGAFALPENSTEVVIQLADGAPEIPAPAAPLVFAAARTIHFEITFSDRDCLLGLSHRGDAIDDPMALQRLVAMIDQYLDGAAGLGALVLRLPGERPGPPPAPARSRRAEAADITAADLILQQATRTPSAVAVRHGSAALTYADVADKTRGLAFSIARRVPPGARVGVALSRSERLPIVIAGIFAAGCAYVPLDPRYPSARLAEMIEASGISLILTDISTSQNVPFEQAEAVSLDEIWDEFNSDYSIAVERDAGVVAYIMFTSGSSGRPKAVAVGHAALVNFLQSMAEEPGLNATDVLLATTTVCFDISLLELLLPLTVGASVAVAAGPAALDGARLLDEARRHGATCMQATPVIWQMLISAGWSGDPPIRALCGGEAMGEQLAEDLLARSTSLWNMYGPTETTVWSSCVQVRSVADARCIGRPIAGTEFLVVDAWNRPVPPGFIGELRIAGVGLAEGYVSDTELTREKFPVVAGARVYRTGDVVRVAQDRLIYLRRRDRQVKLLGHRIEPEEIEAVLGAATHPAEIAVIGQDLGGASPALVAYVCGDVDEAGLRRYAVERLPPFMVPHQFLRVPAMPRLANGKLDLQRLATMGVPLRCGSALPPRDDIESRVFDVWAEALGRRDFGVDENLFDVGGHSLLALRIHGLLCERFGPLLKVVDLFTWPTIEQLARLIAQRIGIAEPAHQERPRPAAHRGSTSRNIAIIGMACRFPGANDLRQFWRNLALGVESVTSLSDQDLVAAGVDPLLLRNPRYVKAAALLDGVELFDAEFFGLNAREAEVMDPQHRLMLECGYSALEDAGYGAISGSNVAVFAGVGFSSYLLSNVLVDRALLGAVSPLNILYANDKDYAATRLAYSLDLRGPCLTVATACSTALVAVHLACRSLVQQDCDMALVGAAKVMTPQRRGYLYEAGGILSPDGHCRAFDQEANGTIFGSGVGAVVLKRLDDARRDRDAIYAVIAGSATNNDGSMKMGYTAPSRAAQAGVIAAALADANFDTASIGYVEAHGTGTSIGDPLELAALNDVFAAAAPRRGFCAIGSVKTNIGHLDPAAGMAGLIKTVLALHQRQIPPSLNFRNANSGFDLADSPFFINTELRCWEAEPRRAGVSSFGIGGTNAHLVLEEAPSAPAAIGEELQPELLTLSARTPTALTQMRRLIAEELQRDDAPSLPDLANTLRLGRRRFPHRWAAVAVTPAEAIVALLRDDENLPHHTAEHRRLVFMFPGQGSQYAGMAARLYAREPVFRATLDKCLAVADDALGAELRRALLKPSSADEALLAETRRTQPAVFAVEMSLARLLISCGLEPAAMIGHSLGEYVAATLAETFTLEAAMQLVIERARLMGSCPLGRMAAVAAPSDRVQPLLATWCEVAAHNSLDNTVIAGPPDAVERSLAALREMGIEARMLRTSHAFHTQAMEPALDDFAAALRQAAPRPPSKPFISNLTGDWIDSEQAVDPSYWCAQLRRPVLFRQGLVNLLALAPATLLEVGPGTALTSFARREGHSTPSEPMMAPRGNPPREDAGLFAALGRLWCAGHRIEWAALDRERSLKRVHLPPYPFERKRYWIEPRDDHLDAFDAPPQKLSDISEWFYEPSWKRGPKLPRSSQVAIADTPWLIIGDGRDDSLECAVLDRLREAGAHVMHAVASASPNTANGRSIDPLKPDGYAELLRALGESPAVRIVFFCDRNRAAVSHLAAADSSFTSLVMLGQALVRVWSGREALIGVVAASLHQTLGDEAVIPAVALCRGPVRSLPLELPGTRWAAIDFLPAEQVPSRVSALAGHVIAEFLAGLPDAEVAYRSASRWLAFVEPRALHNTASKLVLGGAYLISGGLGGLGLALAAHLVTRWGARLAIVGRSSVSDGPRATMLQAALAQLRGLGRAVAYVEADIADPVAAERALGIAEARFGRVDGMFHLAGVPDGALLEFRRRDEMAAVLAPKLSGGANLSALLRQGRGGFLVLFSSVVAVTGGIGQVAYVAANAYLDALACADRVDGYDTTSIGWDAWSEVGMARRSELPAFLAPLHEDILRNGIRTEEGLAVLERVLAQEAPHIVVSTRKLEQRIAMQRHAVSEARTARAPASSELLLTRGDTASPETVQQVLATLWQESLGIDGISVLDNYFDLGGTSLQAIRLITRINARLGTQLEPPILLQHSTISDIAAVIVGAAQPPEAASHLVPLNSGDPELVPLVLVHPVGGEIFYYRDLVQRLRTRRPIFGLRALTGRRYASVEDMAQAYVDVLERLVSSPAFALGGSSFGGMVAFAMASRLRDADVDVPLLLLIDTPVGDQITAPFADDADVVGYLAPYLPQEGAPCDDELNEMVSAFRAHDAAMRRYQPAPYRGPVSYIKARERRAGRDPLVPEAVWRDLCPTFRLFELPGDHMTLHAPPFVQGLAKVVDSLLADIDGATNGQPVIIQHQGKHAVQTNVP
jgi:amino acid adenylation domain-containing protein